METALEILCDLHNNHDERHLHDALQHVEDAIAASPEMSARDFLLAWHAFVLIEEAR